MIVPICEDDSTATVVDGHPSSITTSAIAALLGSNTNMVGTDPQSPPSFRSSSWRSVNRGQHCLDPSVGVPTVPVSLASSSRTPSHDSNEPSFHRPRLAPIFTGQGTEYPANPLSSSEPHLTGRMAQLLLKSPRPHAQLKQASPLDLYFLGISTLICGVLFSWNEGLTHGFWEYFAVLLATLVAYWCLILCLSEMSSALPFNGGMYGFVRLAIGSAAGYLVGCSEVAQNILGVATTVLPLGWIITALTRLPADYEPLYWCIFYGISLFVCIQGGNLFWQFNRSLAIITLLLIAIYVLGTIQYIDYFKYATNDHPVNKDGDYAFDGMALLQIFPSATWYFQGVEFIPLAGVTVSDPKRSLVKAMIMCMITCTMLVLIVPFVVCSQSPGTIGNINTLLPMNTGYSKMFDIPEFVTYALAIPGTFATAFGFFFFSARQLSAMGKSGLFPTWIGKSTKKENTPYAALMVCCVVGMAINFIGLSDVVMDNFLEDLFLLCLLGSYVVYICTFVAFIIYKYKFSSLEKSFTNPFGVWSAYFGIAVFVIDALSVVAFQGGNYRVIVIFVAYLSLCFTYYYCYSSKTMFYSEEEQTAMFNAYVIRANAYKKQRRVKPVVSISVHSTHSSNSLQSTSSPRHSSHSQHLVVRTPNSAALLRNSTQQQHNLYITQHHRSLSDIHSPRSSSDHSSIRSHV